MYKNELNPHKVSTGTISKQPEAIGSICDDVYQVKTPIPARIGVLEQAGKLPKNLKDYQDA